MEHLCAERVISFGSVEPKYNNETTNGGYSNNYVVAQNFAVKIPGNAQMEKVAPLMCAGINAYSPVLFSKVKKGDKVGVAGFGGIGHMAVKYAVALGAEVTVFDITEDKRQDALRLGAVKYVNVRRPAELQGLNNSLNVIINIIPSGHDPLVYLKMIRLGGEMAVLGLPPTAAPPRSLPRRCRTCH
ncbi:zinc-binding dehydrogenase [Pseudomonas syringae]|uniref:zinc-binding dehydrogenase n=1 Tax=Pseudomonas syringae TaxID=317 RepID=UPI001F937642|nr:zinc-binding dehydrogenase [Pseudomonas syringae]